MITVNDVIAYNIEHTECATLMKEFEKHVESLEAFTSYLSKDEEGKEVKNFTTDSLVELCGKRDEFYKWCE